MSEVNHSASSVDTMLCLLDAAWRLDNAKACSPLTTWMAAAGRSAVRNTMPTLAQYADMTFKYIRDKFEASPAGIETPWEVEVFDFEYCPWFLANLIEYSRAGVRLVGDWKQKLDAAFPLEQRGGVT